MSSFELVPLAEETHLKYSNIIFIGSSYPPVIQECPQVISRGAQGHLPKCLQTHLVNYQTVLAISVVSFRLCWPCLLIRPIISISQLFLRTTPALLPVDNATVSLRAPTPPILAGILHLSPPPWYLYGSASPKSAIKGFITYFNMIQCRQCNAV